MPAPPPASRSIPTSSRPIIVAYGSEEQKRHWLPQDDLRRDADRDRDDRARRRLRPPGHPHHRDQRDGNDYVINGSKTYITNGQHADLIIVVAKTDPAEGAKGISLILVEADRDGFARGRNLDKIGLHGQDTSELFFQDVRVPQTNCSAPRAWASPI